MNLLNESINFTPENIAIIEKTRNAKWVIDTEKPERSNLVMSIFYQEEAYPDTGSHYFGLYKTPKAGPTPETAWQLMITDGSWVEDLEISAVEADNGDVIFSKFRHDYVTSPDGTAMIDGGRAYTRRSLNTPTRTIKVKDGQVLLS